MPKKVKRKKIGKQKYNIMGPMNKEQKRRELLYGIKYRRGKKKPKKQMGKQRHTRRPISGIDDYEFIPNEADQGDTGTMRVYEPRRQTDMPYNNRRFTAGEGMSEEENDAINYDNTRVFDRYTDPQAYEGAYRRPKKKSKRRLMLWPKRSKTRRIIYMAKKPKKRMATQKYGRNFYDMEVPQRQAYNDEIARLQARQDTTATERELQRQSDERRNSEAQQSGMYQRRRKPVKHKRVNKKGLTLWPKKTKKKRNIVW